MNVLITASIGLIQCEGKYFLQVIPAESEISTIIPITRDMAHSIHETESLEIELMDSGTLQDLKEPAVKCMSPFELEDEVIRLKGDWLKENEEDDIDPAGGYGLHSHE